MQNESLTALDRLENPTNYMGFTANRSIKRKAEPCQPQLRVQLVKRFKEFGRVKVTRLPGKAGDCEKRLDQLLEFADKRKMTISHTEFIEQGMVTIRQLGGVLIEVQNEVKTGKPVFARGRFDDGSEIRIDENGSR